MGIEHENKTILSIQKLLNNWRAMHNNSKSNHTQYIEV